MSPSQINETEACEVETSRVIRPNSALAWRTARMAVIRQARKDVSEDGRSEAPADK